MSWISFTCIHRVQLILSRYRTVDWSRDKRGEWKGYEGETWYVRRKRWDKWRRGGVDSGMVWLVPFVDALRSCMFRHWVAVIFFQEYGHESWVFISRQRFRLRSHRYLLVAMLPDCALKGCYHLWYKTWNLLRWVSIPLKPRNLAHSIGNDASTERLSRASTKRFLHHDPCCMTTTLL